MQVTEMPGRVTFTYVTQLNDKLILKNNNEHRILHLIFFTVDDMPVNTRIGYIDRVETWLENRRMVRDVEYREVFVERGAAGTFEWRKVGSNVEFRKDGMINVMWMQLDEGVLERLAV
jgi:hypothetical protein